MKTTVPGATVSSTWIVADCVSSNTSTQASSVNVAVPFAAPLTATTTRGALAL
jgi:hypothetical protein